MLGSGGIGLGGLVHMYRALLSFCALPTSDLAGWLLRLLGLIPEPRFLCIDNKARHTVGMQPSLSGA